VANDKGTVDMRDLSYRSPKTEVGKSRIHGNKLFAKESIVEGEIAAVKGGFILPRGDEQRKSSPCSGLKKEP
jgi:hypothetical protein